ncbi:hypothetical protein B0J14DRAFT_655702 [Halenospora varia]|nr:hypothetical protein B0J14DRAFT_655702 [Halenospora varia]
MVLPLSDSEPEYRDDYSDGPWSGSGGFHRNFLSVLSRCPEVVVPIGQIPYDSRVSHRREVFPAVASFLGAPGSDHMLSHLVHDVLRTQNLPTTGASAIEEAWQLKELYVQGYTDKLLIFVKMGQRSEARPPSTCEFHHTPKAIRDLIEGCTRGDPEWMSQPQSAVVRQCEKLYPKGKTGIQGEPIGTVEETLAAAKSPWSLRIENMKNFVRAQIQFKKGKATEDDLCHLSYLKRPRLAEGMQFLSAFKYEMKLHL